MNDNLAKHNWWGEVNCCFCYKNEIIKHMFFGFCFVHVAWSTVQAASYMTPNLVMCHVYLAVGYQG